MLYNKVKKYLEANSKTWEAEQNNILLRDDMIAGFSSPYIDRWDVSGLAEPTAEQLASYEAAAIIDNNNDLARENRKAEYGSNTQQIENIIENGLSAEQARVQAIKEKYPKE